MEKNVVRGGDKKGRLEYVRAGVSVNMTRSYDPCNWRGYVQEFCLGGQLDGGHVLGPEGTFPIIQTASDTNWNTHVTFIARIFCVKPYCEVTSCCSLCELFRMFFERCRV